MKQLKKNELVIQLVSFLMGGSVCLAEPAADNSAINVRDRLANEQTADQQAFNEKDTEITRRIRQELINDKKLSTYGQNIKIISVNGKVTLKGPVNSKRDAVSILERARQIAGAKNVKNEMTVMSNISKDANEIFIK